MPTFKVRAYLKASTDGISEALRDNDPVDLEGLGTFKPVKLPSRKVTTVFGGKKRELKLDATTSVDFSVNKELEDEVKTTPASQAPKEEVEGVFRTSPIDSRVGNIQFIELNGKVIPKEILALVPEVIAKKTYCCTFCA